MLLRINSKSKDFHRVAEQMKAEKGKGGGGVRTPGKLAAAAGEGKQSRKPRALYTDC